MSGNNVRKTGYDIARAIAFIAVVWGHLFPLHGMWFVYGFHLQVFYFISGWFLNPDKHVKSYIYDKLKRLIIPYILVGILISLSMMINEGKSWDFFSEQMSCYFLEGTTPIGPMWFLPALFVALLTVYSLAKTKYGMIFLPAIVWVAYIVSINTKVPFFILHGFVDAGYVGMGYLAAGIAPKLKTKMGDRYDYSMMMVFIISMTVWIIFQRTMPGMVYLYANDFPRGPMDYFGPMAAVFSIIYISDKVLDRIPVVNRYLSFVGRQTMAMICIHEFDIFLNIVNRYVGVLPIHGMKLNAVQLVAKIAAYSMVAWGYSAIKCRITDRVRSH